MALSGPKHQIFQALDECLKQQLACLVPASDFEIIHYTNIDGLIGILKSGALFAGNLIAMNDASEFVHGKELLLKIISTSNFQNHPSVSQVAAYVKKRLVGFREPPRAFVVSFTAKKDATTHWQGYAGSSGVAIHFDGLKIAKQAIHGRSYLAPCVYQTSSQNNFITTLFAELLNRCHAAFNHQFGKTADEIEWLGEVVTYNIGRAAAVIKSDAFEHEDEWRCIHYLAWDGGLPEGTPDLSALEFINRSGMLSARLSLNLAVNNLLPIKTVTLGPSQHQRANVLTLPVLLAKYGYENVPVRASRSPWREL